MKRFAIAVARVVIKTAVLATAGLFAMLYLIGCIAAVGIGGPAGLALVVVATLVLGTLLLREDRQRGRGR